MVLLINAQRGWLEGLMMGKVSPLSRYFFLEVMVVTNDVLSLCSLEWQHCCVPEAIPLSNVPEQPLLFKLYFSSYIQSSSVCSTNLCAHCF